MNRNEEFFDILNILSLVIEYDNLKREYCKKIILY